MGVSVLRRLSSKINDNRNRINWAVQSIVLSGIMFAVLTCLEIVIIRNNAVFLDYVFTKSYSGAAPIINVYISLFVLGLAWQLGLAIDANYSKNTTQVGAIAIFNAFLAGLSGLQIQQMTNLKSCTLDAKIAVALPDTERKAAIKELNDYCFFNLKDIGKSEGELWNQRVDEKLEIFNVSITLVIVVAVMMMILTLVGFFFAYKSYQQHGWSVFEVQGADISKRKILSRYQSFMLFLKLNAFFFLAVVAQGASVYYFIDKTNGANSWVIPLIAVITIVVTCAFHGIGYYGAKTSNPTILGVFLILMMFNFLGLLYILFLVYVDDVDAYMPTRLWMTTAVVAEMISIFVTYSLAVLVILDFKDGLKEVIQRINSNASRTESHSARFEIN